VEGVHGPPGLAWSGRPRAVVSHVSISGNPEAAAHALLSFLAIRMLVNHITVSLLRRKKLIQLLYSKWKILIFLE
jgi:hypothetical protein